MLIVCLFCNGISSQARKYTINIQGKHIDDSKTHMRRSPAVIPVEAYYDSFISGIAITFLQDLGNVEVNVTNHSTGEYLEGTMTATTGTTVLPISGTEGVYTITFTLSNGTEYEGEFEL